MKIFHIFFIIILFHSALPGKELKETDRVDAVLVKKIEEYRMINHLPGLMFSKVLQKASEHHALYMAKTRIVSHFQQMELVSMKSLYSPRKRIAYFANNMITEDNHYAEIVIGLKLKENDPVKLAEYIWKKLINSENRVILDDCNARYFGLTTVIENNYCYLTIKFGLGYDNIVALLEE